jgi:hypothetical protein
MHDVAGAPVREGGERLDTKQNQGGTKDHDQRERHHAPACDVMGCEERRIAAEHVKQRQGDRQRGNPDQMHTRARQRDPTADSR